MRLQLVPLLQPLRDLYRLPRDYARFRQYLGMIVNDTGDDLKLPPLVAANPMAKDHVALVLDSLLALDAEAVAAQAVADAAAMLPDVPGDYKVGLTIADDSAGGWTNRYACEYALRFPDIRGGQAPRLVPDSERSRWITAVLWSSEPASAQAVREAVLTSVHRLAYFHRHGPARTLRGRMAQEGHVMASAGCTGPTLEADDPEYTREVIAPFLDAEDMRTTIECLCGDAAGKTLGFTPRGLSLWAGLALALHEARQALDCRHVSCVLP